MPNITYLFGAGASKQACPILRGLGENMIALSEKYLDPEIASLHSIKSNLNTSQRILTDILYFGKKALQYGTIDTYAKKLFLSDEYKDLERLKFSLSIFFTIWESMDDDLKKRKEFIDIDIRYISLLSQLLLKNQSRVPYINEKFKFVTWNYDLQFERALKSFCKDQYTWNDISKDLRFMPNGANNEYLNICHLNGYNGYYSIELNADNSFEEVDTIDRIKEKDVHSILNELEFLAEDQNRNRISFRNHINYAWENNKIANDARFAALDIFKKTEILIIIGYSFPPFNKDVDQKLFHELNGRKTKIYYQDPNASKEFISTLVKGFDTEIHCITDKVDHFFLPYEF